jgi:hypothetical protein
MASHALVDLLRDLVIRPYPDGRQHRGQQSASAAAHGLQEMITAGQWRRMKHSRAPSALSSCIHFSYASDGQSGWAWQRRLRDARRHDDVCLVAALWGASIALVGAGLAYMLETSLS